MNAQGLSRQLNHALRQVANALTVLEHRGAAAVARDENGGTNDRDGFGASGLGGGAPMSVLHCDEHERDNCPCGNNAPVDVPSDRTGNAAASEPKKDPVHAAASAMVNHLDQAVKSLQGAVSQVALIEHLAKADGRHTNPPTNCQACDRLVLRTAADPIRSGYCSSCDTAWRRFKEAERSEGREPDRVRFEHQRRQESAA